MKNSVTKILFVRLISSIIILFLLISSIFILLRIAPGDPAQKFISPELSTELAGKVRESFHLNGSILDQYLSFIKNLVSGNFGISYTYHTPVLSVIKDYLLFTLIFASISFSVQIIASYHLALIAFKKRGRFLDKAFSGISLVIYSVPAFVIAIVLIYIFSVKLQLLPSSDLKSIHFEELTFPEKVLDYFKHLILPVLTLSLGGIVMFYKYLRDNFDSISKKSFVLYLRTLGMNDNEILKKHIIPNSLGPLISVAGVRLGMLLSGTLITEVIFGLPGMGRLTVNAILLRDYPLVVGCAFVSGVIIIISNLLADILKVKIDKRLVKEILN
ncbi:MAG: ABC transporter permease [Melioribacteraceae bacterium]|nr:ABC transporter permease [Melioribacteraceae bacterium]